MTPLAILFGTESGNAEMVADDIAAVLESRSIGTEIVSMENADLEKLSATELAIVITSTYGEGELPMTALPFHESLCVDRPDLTSLRFAAFGLGDSVYDTYNNAIEIFVELMTELGAKQVGVLGKFDASGSQSYEEAARAWAETNIESLLVAAEGNLKHPAG